MNNLRWINLKNNKWLHLACLENGKLIQSESAEKYIEDMSKRSLLVDLKEEELSKALIRGLPPKLVSFNPTALNETIQRILLGEATLLLAMSMQRLLCSLL